MKDSSSSWVFDDQGRYGDSVTVLREVLAEREQARIQELAWHP
jgi:hypothetical protein